MTCWFCKNVRECRPICSTCFDMYTTRNNKDKELIQAVFDHVVWMIGDPDFDSLIKLIEAHPDRKTIIYEATEDTNHEETPCHSINRK